MIPEFIAFLLSVVTSSAVAGLIVFVSRTWIAERLRQAISHEYATKLEAHRMMLRAEYDTQIERLRGDIARQHALESAARTSLAEIHLASHQRRLDALEAAWDAIIEMRDHSSAATMYLNVLTDEELQALPNNERARLQIERTGGNTAIDRITNAGRAIDRVQPLVGDRIFTVLYVYRAILCRVEYLLARSLKRDHFEPWWTDTLVHLHLQLVVTAEDLSQVDAMRLNRFGYVRTLLEAKLLQEINSILSGESAARFSVETAAAIARVKSQVRDDT